MPTAHQGAGSSTTVAKDPHPRERAQAWLQRELTSLQTCFGLSEVELLALVLDEVERRQAPIEAWWRRLVDGPPARRQAPPGGQGDGHHAKRKETT